MVDRIGNAQDYNRYISVEQKRTKETDEKFTLDQTGVKSSDSNNQDSTLIQKKKTDENKSEEFGTLTQGTQKSIRKKSGVILELSDQEETVSDTNAEESGGKSWISDWKSTAETVVQKAKDMLKKAWDIIWNSPEDKTQSLAEQDVSVQDEEMSDSDENFAAVENVTSTQNDQNQMEEQDGKPDLQAFLEGTQKGDLAKNTELLSYYDKKGRMVQISNKDRILHNK